MNFTRNVYFFVLVLLIGCDKKDDLQLFEITTRPISPTIRNDNAVIRALNVTANLSVLFKNPEKISIPLPASENVIVLKTKSSRSKSQLFWVGKVKNEPQSVVYFTLVEGVITGNIMIKTRLYRITFAGNNVYQIAELAAIKLLETANDVAFPGGLFGITPPKEDCADPITQIDVMVVFTDEAEQQAGGGNAMKSLIAQSFNLTNDAYSKSSIKHRVRLIYSQKINYVETGNGETDVKALQGTKDGKIDNVHALRNHYKADVVVMIVEKLSDCGYAFYIPASIAGSFADNTFAVVKRSCSASSLTFAHELGHLMGGRHDSDPGKTPYPYCHGYDDNTWRTVMSVDQKTVRATYFSNPYVKFPSGIPTGILGKSENYNVFNFIAPSISHFRCSK